MKMQVKLINQYNTSSFCAGIPTKMRIQQCSSTGNITEQP